MADRSTCEGRQQIALSLRDPRHPPLIRSLPFSPACLLIALLAAVVAASAHAANIPEEPSPLVAVGDFNGDGIADMVEATPPGPEDAGLHSLTVLLGRGDGTFRRLPSHNFIGPDPRALVVGDFNEDGHPDVIVGDADGTLLAFTSDGKGDLHPAGKLATLGSIVSIAVGHFTHDGHLDLAVSDIESNTATILLGSGNGSFRQTWSFQLPQRGHEYHLATADFNKDGVSDLVITNNDDENYEVMLGNGNGTFTYAPKLSHLRDPYSYCPT
jgi:FG-GAP-like repeat